MEKIKDIRSHLPRLFRSKQRLSILPLLVGKIRKSMYAVHWLHSLLTGLGLKRWVPNEAEIDSLFQSQFAFREILLPDDLKDAALKHAQSALSLFQQQPIARLGAKPTVEEEDQYSISDLDLHSVNGDRADGLDDQVESYVDQADRYDSASAADEMDYKHDASSTALPAPNKRRTTDLVDESDYAMLDSLFPKAGPNPLYNRPLRKDKTWYLNLNGPPGEMLTVVTSEKASEAVTFEDIQWMEATILATRVCYNPQGAPTSPLNPRWKDVGLGDPATPPWGVLNGTLQAPTPAVVFANFDRNKHKLRYRGSTGLDLLALFDVTLVMLPDLSRPQNGGVPGVSEIDGSFAVQSSQIASTEKMLDWLLSVVRSPLTHQRQTALMDIACTQSLKPPMVSSLAERILYYCLTCSCPDPKISTALNTVFSINHFRPKDDYYQRRNNMYGVYIVDSSAVVRLEALDLPYALIDFTHENTFGQLDMRAAYQQVLDQFTDACSYVYVRGIPDVDDLFLKWCCEYTVWQSLT